MQILQLIGVLVILNSVTCAGWVLAQGKSLGLTGTTLLTISVVAGLALTFHERAIEISFGKVATLKAAAQQATSDAKEIASIRQRVEAQAATLNLVAKESSDAKRLLGELRDENSIADQKLKLLEEKTTDIVQLPDGRTKMGNMLTGKPSILEERFNAMISAYKEKRYEDAYNAAKQAVRLHEDSAKQLTGAFISTASDASPEGIAAIYSVAAEMAQRHGDHEQALVWATTAAAKLSTPDRQAFLVTALIKSKKQDEAQALVNDTIAKGGPDAERFKTLLRQAGILVK